jgi:folate-binding protein YgfZ
MTERNPLYDAEARAGATFLEEVGWLVPAHFGDADAEYRYAREQAVVFDESHRGKVELRGPDAKLFLHRLCSNDVARLPPGGGCEAFLATAKAKIVSHFFVFLTCAADGTESLWLDLAPGLAAKTVQHLDHYLISEQVELFDRTRERAQLSLLGSAARSILDNIPAEPLPEMRHLQQVERKWQGNILLSIRRNDALGLPGYDLLCEPNQGAELWQALQAAGARPAGQNAYHRLRIEAGLPLYGVDMDENNLAMEVGRTPQAISYAKGCFPGQEPIVRSRDLGHVNWSFRGFRVSGTAPISPGTRLHQEGKEVGRITSSTNSPRGDAMLALGYARRGHDSPGTKLEVAAEEGPRSAEVVSLPFSA